MKPLKIEDDAEIWALYVTILAAKFDPNPTNPNIQGSPLVANVVNKIYDSLTESEYLMNRGFSKKIPSLDWKRDRKVARDSSTVKFVENRLSDVNVIDQPDWDAPKMRRFISVLLAPYVVSEEDMAALVEFGLKQYESST